jgi:hypothetical protein
MSANRGGAEKAFIQSVNDSISVQVNLKYDVQGLPDYYFCHVNMPVCEEGLCRLMIVDVYWDVLGNFLKYELPPGEALTKMDHVEFTTEDHQKLRSILSNKASILRDYPLDDLMDRSRVVKSKVVDAVSAATRVEVKDAIVSGAAYSTYALWHVVNGPIASRIEEYTRPLVREALVLKMFRSNDFYYQYYALNHVPEGKMKTYVPEIIDLVNRGVSYIPYFAIEKVPEEGWSVDDYQVALLKNFRSADFELQNAFIGKIADVKLCSDALDELVAACAKITDKQLERVVEVIARNADRLSDEGKAKLAGFCSHADKKVAEVVRGIVKKGC